MYQSLIWTNAGTVLYVIDTFFSSNHYLGETAVVTIIGEAHFEKCRFWGGNGALKVLFPNLLIGVIL